MPPKKLNIRKLPQPPKGGKRIPQVHTGAVLMGTPYSIDKARDVVNDLFSKELSRALQATITFMENNVRISEAISKMPDVSVSDVTDRVVKIIKENEEQIFRVIRANKNIGALQYLVSSPAVPPEVKERARKELRRLKGEVGVIRPPTRRIPELKAFTPQQVMRVWNNLNSNDPTVSVKAAITVFGYYPRIARTLSKIPDLTPTKMLGRAIEVTYTYPDAVYGHLYLSRQKNALLFMTQSKAVPSDLAKRAQEVLQKIEGPQTTPAPKPMAGEEVKKSLGPAREYLPQQVEQLWKNLTSSDVAKAIPATIEFFSNYQAIVPTIMKVPLLTVTEMSNAAIRVLAENSGKIFRIIEQTRNIGPLRFIAESSKIPLKLRKKAEKILLRMEMEEKRRR